MHAGKKMVDPGTKSKSKKHPNGRPPTYERCTIYSYRFQRPCGHTHTAAATWETPAEAEYHEAWARDNTLCESCARIRKASCPTPPTLSKIVSLD